MSKCSKNAETFYSSLAIKINGIHWYKAIVERLVRKCLLPDGALSSIYPPHEGTAVYSEWDDLVPTLLLFGHYDFLLDQIVVAQKYLHKGLPIKYGGLVYSWRVDEFLAGLIEMDRYRSNHAVSNQIDRSLDGLQSTLMRSNGHVRGIYDPVDTYSPNVFYARAGGLLEVLLNRNDLEKERMKGALECLDWWIENPFFIRQGLFPCKWFSRRSIMELWANSGRFVPVSDGPFQKSGNSYIERGGLKSFRKVLWIPSNRVQLMKDNSNLIFAFMEAWRKTGNSRYAATIIRWCKSVYTKMRSGPFICSTWHPRTGSADPRLSQNFTFIDILCDTYAFIDAAPIFLDIAHSLARAWVERRWRDGLVPSTPNGNMATIDEQTDFAVSLVKLGELSGDKRYREIAEDITAGAERRFLSSKGLVVSVDSQGNWMDYRVATKYNLLFAKALAAIHSHEKIYECPMLHDFLKDR